MSKITNSWFKGYLYNQGATGQSKENILIESFSSSFLGTGLGMEKIVNYGVDNGFLKMEVKGDDACYYLTDKGIQLLSKEVKEFEIFFEMDNELCLDRIKAENEEDAKNFFNEKCYYEYLISACKEIG